MKNSLDKVDEACRRLGIKPGERILLVRIGLQRMFFFRNGCCERVFVISTSKKPPSNIKNSEGTPLGLHRIAERIGAGLGEGMVLVGRVPTGQHFEEADDGQDRANLITTRILRLRGLEPGINLGGDVDSYERYVYIHGTNREDRLGIPQSKGCVLMSNRDIIELFDEISEGDFLLICD